MSRRADCAYLARLVADHRLDMDEAQELAHELAYGLAKRAYKLYAPGKEKGAPGRGGALRRFADRLEVKGPDRYSAMACARSSASSSALFLGAAAPRFGLLPRSSRMIGMAAIDSHIISRKSSR